MSWYLMMNCGLEWIVGFYSQINRRGKTLGHRYSLTFFERSFLRPELNQTTFKCKSVNLKLGFEKWTLFWIEQLFFGGMGYEIKGTNIGHVIFSDLKITIRSCLEAVVLIEADNQ